MVQRALKASSWFQHLRALGCSQSNCLKAGQLPSVGRLCSHATVGICMLEAAKKGLLALRNAASNMIGSTQGTGRGVAHISRAESLILFFDVVQRDILSMLSECGFCSNVDADGMPKLREGPRGTLYASRDAWPVQSAAGSSPTPAPTAPLAADRIGYNCRKLDSDLQRRGTGYRRCLFQQLPCHILYLCAVSACSTATTNRQRATSPTVRPLPPLLLARLGPVAGQRLLVRLMCALAGVTSFGHRSVLILSASIKT